MDRIKLFCLPYAGGTSVIFNTWKRYLSSNIELHPVELAGRGRRMRDALYRDVDVAVNDLIEQVKPQLTGEPYAFFGHSMGAMLAYELVHTIQAKGMQMPIHIFFSGRGAPCVARDKEIKYHLLSENEFKTEVLELGGTPPEFFDHPELLELFMPILKNDFKLAETAVIHEKITPLDCDITIFTGKDEDLNSDQRNNWMKHTNGICSMHYFNGGHFFLNEVTDELVRFINLTLACCDRN